MKIKILNLFTDGKNVGDNSAAFAAAREVESRLEAQFGKNCEINNVKIDVENKSAELLSYLERESDKIIVIGSGAHLLEPMKNLKEANPDIITFFASHQIPQNLGEYLSSLNLVSFPTHILKDLPEGEKASFQNKLVETVGVAHNLVQSDLDREYDIRRQNGEVPDPSEKIALVILGGDALLPHEINGKKYQYYIKKDAEDLAEYSADLIDQGFTVYATCGNRTGMLNPETEESLHTHRLIHPVTKAEIDYQIDPVSQAYIERIAARQGEAGRESDQNFKFFDFKFLEKGVDSAYKALLTAVQKNPGENLVLVPGESTSMISECCDMVPNQSVIIVPNSAMNPSHIAHVASVIESGQAKLLEPQSKEVSSQITETTTSMSAASKIACRIVDQVERALKPRSATQLISGSEMQQVGLFQIG